MVSEPTVDDVLWLLDNNYGTDYGDVVRKLQAEVDALNAIVVHTPTVKAWKVTVTRPDEWKPTRHYTLAWFNRLMHHRAKPNDSCHKIYRHEAPAWDAVDTAQKCGFLTEFTVVMVPKTIRAAKVGV